MDYTPHEMTKALSSVYARMIEEGWMKPVPPGVEMNPSALTEQAKQVMRALKKLFRGRGREFTDVDYAAFVSIVLHTPEAFDLPRE